MSTWTRVVTPLSAAVGVLLLLPTMYSFRAVRIPAALGQTGATAPAPAADDEGTEVAVIPPGQEALLA